MSETARRYSGRLPEERDAERRRRLIRAGRALFGTAGYTATSVERLCADAKVSTRHFYQLYDNKEDAFLDVYDEISRQSFDRAIASLEATASLPMSERVPAAFLAYVGPMVEDLHAARIAFVEIMGVSPRLEERRLSFRESLIGLVEAEGGAAVARGEVTDRDFRFATLALAGAANAIVYDWATSEPRRDVADLEHDLAELALTLLTR